MAEVVYTTTKQTATHNLQNRFDHNVQGDTDDQKRHQMDQVVQGTSAAGWMRELVKFIATAQLEFQQRSSEPWSLRNLQTRGTN